MTIMKKTAYIYLRLELPDSEKIIDQLSLSLREYAVKNDIEVLETYVDKEKNNFNKFAMMFRPDKEKALPDYILLQSLHALTKKDLLGIFGKLGSIVNKGITAVSVEDNFEVTKDNFDLLVSSFRILDATNKRIKRDKINLGIYKKKLSSPDGKVHAPGKKGGNYRKTDKDEIVSKLREDGMTLQQIAEKEEMSIGRVRNILNALKEKQLDNLSANSFLPEVDREPNNMS
jgi:DNA invertase Pin-like site-specific DNA recombinase